MVRGTTAQFKFAIPYEFSQCADVQVIFWQPGNNALPLTKDRTYCHCSEDNPKEVSVILSAYETMKFLDDRKAYVQFIGTTSVDFGLIRFAGEQQAIKVYPISPYYVDDGTGAATPFDPYADLIIFDGNEIMGGEVNG